MRKKRMAIRVNGYNVSAIDAIEGREDARAVLIADIRGKFISNEELTKILGFSII